ncbi:hypothetical protein D1155_04870 [Anaerotruncus sp. 80]|uniref:Uncharacterized protein n=1 Tax=Anaerotruncus colihominis TaxID=169435 RepID=A0A845QG18_9FIRM|nr:hypothetical protein [Anaerotruncus colihominis]NCF01637.1 hypothetical protein [Anaerotruncus sp. 80]
MSASWIPSAVLMSYPSIKAAMIFSCFHSVILSGVHLFVCHKKSSYGYFDFTIEGFSFAFFTDFFQTLDYSVILVSRT